MRADPTLHRTPFIMVTADVKTQSVIAAKKAGVNSYIIKPFDALRLKSKIELAFAAVGNSSDFASRQPALHQVSAYEQSPSSW